MDKRIIPIAIVVAIFGSLIVYTPASQSNNQYDPQETYLMWVCSDMHVVGPGYSAHTSLGQWSDCIGDALGMSIDSAFCNGDWTDWREAHGETFADQFGYWWNNSGQTYGWKDVYDNTDVSFAVVGNHDGGWNVTGDLPQDNWDLDTTKVIGNNLYIIIGDEGPGKSSYDCAPPATKCDCDDPACRFGWYEDCIDFVNTSIQNNQDKNLFIVSHFLWRNTTADSDGNYALNNVNMSFFTEMFNWLSNNSFNTPIVWIGAHNHLNPTELNCVDKFGIITIADLAISQSGKSGQYHSTFWTFTNGSTEVLVRAYEHASNTWADTSYFPYYFNLTYAYDPFPPGYDTFNYVGGYSNANELDYVRDLVSFGNYIFVGAHNNYNMTILNAADRQNLSMVSSINVNGEVRGIDISSDGNYAFVTTQFGGGHYGNLTIVNITDIENPSIEGVYVADSVDGACIYNDYVDSTQICFVGDYMEGRLDSVNCTNKSNPTLIQSYNICGSEGVHGVWANETRAFVATYKQDTFYLVDVSDPTSMSNLDTVAGGRADNAWWVYCENPPLIYTTNAYSGTTIYNISGDSISQEEGINHATTATAKPLANETRLFITVDASPDTLYSYDITDPSNAIIKTSTTTGLNGMLVGNIAVIQNYVYVGNYLNDSIAVFRYGGQLPWDVSAVQFISIGGGSNRTSIYTDTPTFIWTIGNDTYSKYHLEIATNSGFIVPEINISDINELNYPSNFTTDGTNITFVLPELYALSGYGMYYCRVRELSK
jgi:hypothetical protein